MSNYARVSLVMIAVAAAIGLACGPLRRAQFPELPLEDPPVFPFEIIYRHGGMFFHTTGLTVDDDRVTSMWIENQVFWSKVGRTEFAGLSELLRSEQFREFLRGIRTSSDDARWECTKVLTLYELGEYPPYAICLEHVESIPEVVVSLVEVVDRCGKSAWASHYDPIMPYVKDERGPPPDLFRGVAHEGSKEH